MFKKIRCKAPAGKKLFMTHFKQKVDRSSGIHLDVFNFEI